MGCCVLFFFISTSLSGSDSLAGLFPYFFQGNALHGEVIVLMVREQLSWLLPLRYFAVVFSSSGRLRF